MRHYQVGKVGKFCLLSQYLQSILFLLTILFNKFEMVDKGKTVILNIEKSNHAILLKF